MFLLFIFINTLLGISNIFSKIYYVGVACSVSLFLLYLYSDESQYVLPKLVKENKMECVQFMCICVCVCVCVL